MFNRKLTDKVFTWLFKAFSFTGTLALGAIVIFIFVQGTEPFLFPTARTLRLVFERLDSVTVNGIVHENPRGFIELPWDTRRINIDFINRGEEINLVLNLAPKNNYNTTLLLPVDAPEATITYPDAYTYSLTYPGTMAGLNQRVHIILPEPAYNIFDFVTGRAWLPTDDKVYGILPMILGSFFVCLGALLLGVPIAILCALFMSEFMPKKIASFFRGGVELLAGIPSVVYGFFGLMVIVPFIRNTFGVPSGSSLLAAIIVLSVMILPTVIMVSEKCLKAVPRSRREASLAVGASKMQTSFFVVLPHARSGVIAAIILGFSRAVGETMAVILVAGNSPQMITNPLQSVRTLTATIALEMGYAAERHANMLFSVGIVLLIMIFILNGFVLVLRRRGGEE